MYVYACIFVVLLKGLCRTQIRRTYLNLAALVLSIVVVLYGSKPLLTNNKKYYKLIAVSRKSLYQIKYWVCMMTNDCND